MGLRRLNLSENRFSGAVPASFVALKRLYYLNISFNELDELPDLSALPVSWMQIKENRFTFEDLLPNFQTSCFMCGPQAKLGEEETREVALGKEVIMKVELDEANCQYQWYLNGKRMNGETSSVLTWKVEKETDVGIFTCKVTHPQLSFFSLERASIEVKLSKGKQAREKE